MAKLPNGQILESFCEVMIRELLAMAKGRLKSEFVERAEVFSDRCVAVAERLDRDRRFRRIIDQLVGAGTSVGANICEADEAMSDKDFRKSLAIVSKELRETGFFLRLCIRRDWLKSNKLAPLLAELDEIKRIVGSILTKTDPRNKSD